MKILFIGGTGIISSAASKLLVERGNEVFHITRGKSFRKIEGVQNLIADIEDKEYVKKIISGQKFDAVVDWICFLPNQAKRDLELFSSNTNQFVFISSASVYQTPPDVLPVIEKTKLENPYWQYSRDKIECENIFMNAFREYGFPATVVRPSHTYDKTLWPMEGGYTTINRMKKDKPVIVHGDGTSIWTLTHNMDFAKGFIGLLGTDKAIGEDFHITSDELLTWNQIYGIVAEAIGVELNMVHIPSEFIGKYDDHLYGSLLGDKTHSMIFDNSKIKSLVPDFSATITFKEGVKEIVQWYESDTSRQVINESHDILIDRIIQEYNK